MGSRGTATDREVKMSDGYEEDLAMYEEAASDTQKQLDNRVLRPPPDA